MSILRKPFSLLACLLALLLVAGCGSSGSMKAPDVAADPSVVAVYGDETLTVSAFEDRYARAVGGREAAADDSLAEYQDFLERFVNFRLKVAAAEAAGLARDSSIQAEINTYRQNLAKPYLLEQEVMEPLVRTLYERQQEMVDVSHILVRVGPDASPQDTLTAYNRIAALVDSLDQGMDFGDVAFAYSEDPSARRTDGLGGRGRLGYFKAGRLIEPFEATAYATPVGARSDIFRTRFGYHVLYVHDRIPAIQDVRLAHILIRPRSAAPDDSTRMYALADSLLGLIQGGADFAALARQYSEDPGSSRNGGDLGFVGYDVNFVEPFKTEAFALEKPGDLSGIVETRFGLHLIKMLERKTPPTYDEAFTDLKAEVSRMPRAQEAEDAFAQQVRADLGTTVDTALIASVFAAVPVDSVFFVLSNQTLADSVLTKTVATLGDSTYTFEDLGTYTVQAQVSRAATSTEQVLALVDPFLTQEAVTYEALRLEQRDAEFATIMQEFRDGLLLFRLMEDSVWTAAAEDSAGLYAYYEPRAEEYRFPDRTRIVSLMHPSDSVLTATVARLNDGLTLDALTAELMVDSTSQFRIDTMFVAGPTGSVYDQALSLDVGGTTNVTRNQGLYMVLINDGIDPARVKTFDEARSEAISDYQQVLEDRMIDDLRARYNVRTFPARLSLAFAEEELDESMTGAVSQPDGGSE